MDAVKAFNSELSSLYDVKPPISKAKMNSLTRGAIKAIKFYKHVVQSVEKFIQKCKPEYKVPGLYVIDSIVRQSRHQFGTEKDVFAPRFAKNMQTTFLNLLKCPPEDKSKVIRVLNLWQKNAVFPPEVIQPLFDLVDPNHPVHKEQSNGVLTSGNNLSAAKTSPPTAKNTPKDQKLFTTAKPIDPAWLAQTKMETANIVNANKLLFLDRLQHLQQLLLKKQEATNEASQSSVKFDKKLLDFDYGEEEDDDVQIATSPKSSQAQMSQHNAIASATNNLESLGLLLANPEVLRQLQTLQQTMQQNSTNAVQHEMEEKMRKMQQMKQQEEEFDKHLAQTVQNLPFAAECELKPSDIMKSAPPPPPPPPPIPVGFAPVVMNPALLQMHPDMSQPPPGYHPPAMPFVSQPPPLMRQAPATAAMGLPPQQSPHVEENNVNRRESSVEIVNCEQSRSLSRSPDRFRRRSRSRSPRARGRERDRKSRSRTRSRSRSRRRRSRSRDRMNDRQKREDSRDRFRNEEDREKERERRKRGLPPLVKEKMSVCSTTLWVGHLSKLVHQEELSDTFGELGDIVSIDLISPRGCAFICMNRRQDAYRALTKLKNHKLQGKAITLAWAPGKGVKGKEWKDYWEVELGVSYIPWAKLNNVSDQDLDLLEEGGMIDEESMPPKLKGRRKNSSDSMSDSTQSTLVQGSSTIPTVTDGVAQPPPASSAPIVDTSQPPPLRPQAPPPLLPPPNLAQMMPPGFSMPRMLGPMGQLMPGLMPNVPIGVPPPNMQGLMPPGMMQQLMQSGVNPPFGAGVGVGLLTQIPMPAPAAPSADKPNATGMPHNVPPLGVPPPTSGEGMPNLPMMRQPFGMPPMPLPPHHQQHQQHQQQQHQQQQHQQHQHQQQHQHPHQQQHHQQHLQQHHQQQQPPLPQQQHPDDMDVEMEDVMCMPMKDHGGNNNNNKPSLSDQLLAAMKDSRGDGERDFRDRERDRERRDRGADRNDRSDGDDRARDRARGRERQGGRDRGRRSSRDNRDRDDRRGERDRDVGERMGHRATEAPMRQDEQKKDGGPKQSLADRLRQLADGTLPLMDERIDRDMRGGGPGPGQASRSDRSVDRERSFADEPRQPPPPPQQPPSLLGQARRPGDGPPSLLDLPAPKFPPGAADFPRDFGREPRELRDFPQRGPGGLGERDGPRGFGPRGQGPMGPGGRGPMDDFPGEPRALMDRRFGGPLDDFEATTRMAADFDMRDRDFEGRGPPRGIDDFDRRPPPPFDFDMRAPRGGDGPPFDLPRGMPDDFDMRDHPDFDPRRRDFFMDPKFGHPGMMGPRGLRGPPMMGPDGFAPRGARGLAGPPMFHGPRGMGPRGMRGNMRPPFNARGASAQPGPPFDGPRGEDFFQRQGPGGPPFDEARPGRGPMPPFGAPAGPMPPPLLGEGPGPWQNGPPAMRMGEEAAPPPPSAEKPDKRSASFDRERRRETRKSRWGNASPSAEQPDDGRQQRALGDGQDAGVPTATEDAQDPARESWEEPAPGPWNGAPQEKIPTEQPHEDFEGQQDEGSRYEQEPPRSREEHFEPDRQREEHLEPPAAPQESREERYEEPPREERYEEPPREERHEEPPREERREERREEPARQESYEGEAAAQEYYEPAAPQEHRDPPACQERIPPQDDFDVAPPEAHEVQQAAAAQPASGAPSPPAQQDSAPAPGSPTDES